MDYQRFFGRRADVVAKNLVGRLLVRTTESGITAGQILEVGAYEDGKEVPSRVGMKYSPGKIFLMPYRGTNLLNISTGKEGFPSCVEVRKLGLHDEVLIGSGKIASYLDISRDFDGLDLGEGIKISGEGVKKSHIIELEGLADNCIGIYAIRRG
jgi:3-methyladenine DNA glycosylase Mpg